MKFLTLFATLATVAQLSIAQYCPKKSGDCSVDNKPSGTITGTFFQEYKESGYKCEGSIEISNECEFVVKDFSYSSPKSDVATKWYGAKDASSTEGTLLAEYTASTNKKFTVSAKGVNAFCWASLIDDVGVIRLTEIDDNNVITVCRVELKKSESTSGDSDSDTSSKTNTDKPNKTEGSSDSKTNTPAAGDSTTKPATAATPATNTKSSTAPTQNSDKDSGAIFNFMTPSTALYVVLLILSFYLYN